ncbi:MAG: bifunctional glutamate N-acetyltransferase/amino-acid acetyltransferase ArgJ [Actinomycetota bacterium]
MALTWPEGIRSSGVACGIKEAGALDLGLLVVEEPSAWAGTFTKNGAAAACVEWSRSLLGSPIRAVVVNSGNANACTGRAGVQAVQATARAVAAELGCRESEVAVASTGPIGVPLPVDRVVGSVGTATAALESSPASLARAIMTTDTTTKTATATVGGCSIVGVAKGAAMLAPNMATMLAFVATDAPLDALALQPALNHAVKRSFDRISVDACESTNDSVFLVTSGRGPAVDEQDFASGLAEVCRSLAEQMVRDAEGGSKLVRIEISGAEDEETATALGKSVAASALWRSALHGADPNWGRVLAALGTVDRKLALDEVQVSIAGHLVFDDGQPTGDLAVAASAMRADDFTVACRVGDSDVAVEILTTDLSPDYVLLNAGGMS